MNIAYTNISKVNAQHLVNSLKVVAKEDISIKSRNANWPRNDVNQIELEEVHYEEPAEEVYFFVEILTN